MVDLLWSCEPRGARPSLAVDRRLGVLRRPGEPLDLDAVQPDEPRAPLGRPAGDVPVQAEPLLDERRGLVVEAIDTESPPGVILQPGGTPGLPVSRRGLGRGVPEHYARLALRRVVDHPGLLEGVERIRPGVLAVPDTQDRRIGRQALVGRAPALAG